jgi:hypothetical protein
LRCATVGHHITAHLQRFASDALTDAGFEDASRRGEPYAFHDRGRRSGRSHSDLSAARIARSYGVSAAGW